MQKLIFTGTIVHLGFTAPNTSQIISSNSLIMETNKGILGDKHYGATRLLDVRESKLKALGFRKGITIANLRQVTLMSANDWLSILNNADITFSEMGKVNFGLQKDAKYTPKIVYGASNENIVIVPDEGFEEVGFSRLPPQSIIIFKKPNKDELRNVILRIEGENNPCFYPENEIRNRIELQGMRADDFKFSELAQGLRGFYASVLAGGDIKIFDRVEIYQ